MPMFSHSPTPTQAELNALSDDAWTPLMARRISRILYTAPETERLQMWREGEQFLIRMAALSAQLASGELAAC